MLREVYIYYFGPNFWMYPKQEIDHIAYLPATGPFANAPAGYPAVYVTGEKEFHALLQINTALRQAFPGDTILVLIPPPVSRLYDTLLM